MKKLLSILLTPIFFVFFGLTLVVFHPILWVARFIFGRKALDKVVTALNFSLMRVMNILGTRMSFNNFYKLPTDVPVVFISNHQSMWDIPPMIWKFRKNRPKFIAKKELARFIPSISFNLKYGGSVSIDRANPKDAIQKIKNFAKSIRIRKQSICIFPEGTRSRDGLIKPFKTSGIEAIIKEIPNAIFVPVVINNTGKIDNKGKFFKNVGVKVSYSLLPARNLSLNNLTQQLEMMRDEMMSVLQPKALA